MVYQDQIETNLLQLITHPETSEMVLYNFCYYFDVNIVSEEKQAKLVTTFFISLHCLQLFFCPPLPYRCSDVSG